MELWIRSQDKKHLDNVYSLGLFEIRNGKETRYVIENVDCVIAEYKTEERALEVLDEIQCHLVNINDSRDSYFYVYEMPKE